MKLRSVSLSFVLWILNPGFAQVTSVAAGTGMSFPTITKSGTVSIDTTKVPLLSTANTFTGNQSVTGKSPRGGWVRDRHREPVGQRFALGRFRALLERQRAIACNGARRAW
jgi:hypothetical protein